MNQTLDEMLDGFLIDLFQAGMYFGQGEEGLSQGGQVKAAKIRIEAYYQEQARQAIERAAEASMVETVYQGEKYRFLGDSHKVVANLRRELGLEAA